MVVVLFGERRFRIVGPRGTIRHALLLARQRTKTTTPAIDTIPREISNANSYG